MRRELDQGENGVRQERGPSLLDARLQTYSYRNSARQTRRRARRLRPRRRGERAARLEAHVALLQVRVARGHIGRIGDDELEVLVAERAEPVALHEGDARAQPGGVGHRHPQRLARAVERDHLGRLELERQRQLVAQGFVSAQTLDRFELAQRDALSRLDVARAGATQARNARGYTELRAVRAGVITEVMAEVGQVVGAGQGLATLAQAGEREVEVELAAARWVGEPADERDDRERGDGEDDEGRPPADQVGEQAAAEGKNWKNDPSGGIIRVALAHGCAPFGNAKARAEVWNFPDPVPVHREPLYTPRPDLVAKYPTYEDKKTFWRLPTLYRSIQTARDWSKDFPMIMTSGRLVEYEGGHLAAAWSMDSIWEDVFAELEDARA